MTRIYPKPIYYNGNPKSRILFVAESPGEEEYENNKPLVGPSGKLFNQVLARNGLNRDQVCCGNVSLYRPALNNFDFLLNSNELKESIDYLYSHIEKYKNNIYVICALGNIALKALTGRSGIYKWRSSILPCINYSHIKVIPTIHPAAVYRNRKLFPVHSFDIKKVISESRLREFNIPELTYNIPNNDLDSAEFREILKDEETLSVDIESVKNSKNIICVGFAPDEKIGYSIPFNSQNNINVIDDILNLENRKLVLQGGMFDVLQLYNNDVNIKLPYYFDTMLAQHVLNPELPKSLAFLASLYTRHPYYKESGRDAIPDENEEKGWSEKNSKERLEDILRYNIKDVCVTYEVYKEQLLELTDIDDINTFKWEMGQLEVAFELSTSGMLRDEERRLFILNKLEEEINKYQLYLNVLGKVEDKSFNVKSPKQMKELLYDKLKLPTQRAYGGRVTTDENAIIKLITLCKGKTNNISNKEWEIKLRICELILRIRGYRQILQYMNVKSSIDNRVRGMVKIWGTETGRWSYSKYVDGTGANLHTFPRELIEYEETN